MTWRFYGNHILKGMLKASRYINNEIKYNNTLLYLSLGTLIFSFVFDMEYSLNSKLLLLIYYINNIYKRMFFKL